MSSLSDRPTADGLKQSIDDRQAIVGVVGLGYVGLPLAMAFADAGFEVIGIDVLEDRVARLLAGDSYIMDVSNETLGRHVREARFIATLDFGSIQRTNVVFVSVPTPFDRAKAPDLSYVIAAGESIVPHLRVGQLIILESTTYPGTTAEVLLPILERSGLRAGTDFFVAFSPERIDPGNRTYRISNTPKVVGGIDPVSTDLAVHILRQVVLDGSVHAVSSTQAAELTKLLENTYRAVNIALVNELAMLCTRMGIDVWEVIDAAATKPYGFTPFYPGPGVGGHCIPVDPYYLSWKARQFDFHTKFIELAAETNIAMPFFTVDRVRRFLGSRGIPLRGARILAVGASFKRDIDDARNSAAIRVMEILRAEGAEIRYHDPHVPEVSLSAELFTAPGSASVRLRSTLLEPQALLATDCVVILVAHSGVDYQAVLDHAPRVFDAVNATRGFEGTAEVERL